MQTTIILSQIFILSVVVLIGVIAARFKVLDLDTKDMLSSIIFNISLPLMLFSNFLKLEVTPRLLENSFIVLAVSGFVVMFLLLGGWVATKIFGIKGREAAVFKAHSMFGNTIFLGFPLISALFGPEGLLYASMYQMVSSIIMWSAGVVILAHGNGTSWKKSLLRVINPNTIATLAGLAFFLLSIKLPKLIISPLSELGAANTWLSMLYIGAMLYFSDRGMLKRKSIYILSFTRLIFIPVLLVALFYLSAVISFGSPDKLVSSVIILEASMPCMATVVIMAKELGADDALAVSNVFISTIFSIATLPLVMILINKFL